MYRKILGLTRIILCKHLKKSGNWAVLICNWLPHKSLGDLKKTSSSSELFFCGTLCLTTTASAKDGILVEQWQINYVSEN